MNIISTTLRRVSRSSESWNQSSRLKISRLSSTTNPQIPPHPKITPGVHPANVYTRNSTLSLLPPMEPLSCPLCLKPHFEGVDALRSTLISVATSRLTCPVCQESLMGLDKLTIHLFSHVDHQNTENAEGDAQVAPESQGNPAADEPMQMDCQGVEKDKCLYCDICNFCFNDESILEMHQKLLHQTLPDQAGNYNYHCHLCSKKFKMRGSLMVHLRVAHYGFGHNGNREAQGDDGQGGVKGGPIGVSNGTREKMQASGNKQWECDICAKMFTTKYFLKKHKRLHTGG